MKDEELREFLSSLLGENTEMPRETYKTLDEVTEAVDFEVEEATGYTGAVMHTPSSEVRYGGHTPRYRTGERSWLELKVSSDTPVKKLILDGLPPIQKGDTVRAYIVKGDPAPGKERYKKREFKEEEHASKIEKIVDGEVVVTYVSK